MKKVFIALVLLSTLFVSCTENSRVRVWGGTQTIELETNERLVNLTWKDADLWILTKQDTTKPTTYSFKEKSQFGIAEGEVVVVEK